MPAENENYVEAKESAEGKIKKKIVIFNALHQRNSSITLNPLKRGVANQNKKSKNLEFILITSDDDTMGGTEEERSEIIQKVAQSVADLIHKNQPLEKIYLCVDFNLGFSGHNRESISELQGHLEQIGVVGTVPIAYIFAGSGNTATPELADEAKRIKGECMSKYGEGEQSELMKFSAMLGGKSLDPSAKPSKPKPKAKPQQGAGAAAAEQNDENNAQAGLASQPLDEQHNSSSEPALAANTGEASPGLFQSRKLPVVPELNLSAVDNSSPNANQGIISPSDEQCRKRRKSSAS